VQLIFTENSKCGGFKKIVAVKHIMDVVYAAV